MSRLRAYLWLILFVSLPVSLFAWGPIGHMTVGYVAYQNLTPAAKARVRELLLALRHPRVPAGRETHRPGRSASCPGSQC